MPRLLRSIGWSVLSLLVSLTLVRPAQAQQVPEIGYMFPPGGQAGTTIDVTLGGYDWTPDIEVFVRDSAAKLELVGTLGPVLVPDPPYWIEKKARRNALPLPREVKARLTLPANLPAGVYSWHAVNANGVSVASDKFVVSTNKEIVEERGSSQPQLLPALPITVSGQILKVEEVDRYRFRATATGPVTCRCVVSAIKSALTPILEVRDGKTGQMLADAADLGGRDLTLTFAAQKDQEYILSLYDIDFRGDRSFTYRLGVSAGPSVVTAVPPAGSPGETREIEFRGMGLVSGKPQWESLKQKVTFPKMTDRGSFSYELITAHGSAGTVELQLSDLPETLAPADVHTMPRPLTVPAAVTGQMGAGQSEHRYVVEGKKGDLWSLSLQGQLFGSVLDLSLAVINPAGKEVSRVDDLPTSTDASLEFAVPAEGSYTLVVSDNSGRRGLPASIYRLVLKNSKPGFLVTVPETLNVPLGAKGVLSLQVVRQGGFKDPIAVSVTGLPPGVTVPAELVVPAGKNDLKIDVSAAADAGTAASFVKVTAKATIAEQPVSVDSRDTLVAVTMKPPFTIDAEGKDDVTKWPRGTTFPAPVLIERNEGFDGEIRLEMAAKQDRERQGIHGPELVVPPGVKRVLYPVFLPEWLETTRTSRMVVNGVVKVPDPKGRVRHLVSRLKTRIGFLPNGALLKIATPLPELEVSSGQPFDIPIQISRTRELTEPLRLELVIPPALEGKISAATITVGPEQSTATVRVVPTPGQTLSGEHELMVRAKLLQQGHLLVMSQTQLPVMFTPQRP